MSDGPAGEPPRGTPSRRALGAMENAVQRARASARSTPSPPPPKPFEPSPAPQSPPVADETATEAPWHRVRLDERWLMVSVAVAATLVVIGAIALALSSGSGGPQQAAPPPASGTTPPGHGSPPAGSRSSGGNSHQPHSSASTATTTTAPPAAPGGPPVISALSPASGAAGQGIQVAGANFLSSSGQIVATFNGQVAPTSCPAQNVCSVTVPPMSSPGSAQVVITTASGTSNALTFTYS